MGYWQWEDWQAFDDWAANKDPGSRSAMYESMFAALDADASETPGTAVPHPPVEGLRTLRTPVAVIYFIVRRRFGYGQLIITSIVSLGN